MFKEELNHLISIGVIEKPHHSEWIAGTFIVPKKDGWVQWIMDFWGLNKSLKHKVYPLWKISEIFQRRSGYQYFTELNISTQYYTFVLDEPSRNLCTFAMPFGLYCYCRLPMGLRESPDIATKMMHSVLDNIDCYCRLPMGLRESPDIATKMMHSIQDNIDSIEFYMDDIVVFATTWTDHISLLSTVLGHLEDVGFTINPLKCEWAVQETDFLGHSLTPNGVKPWHKKVDAILHLQPPTNVKQLRSFHGMVNYYRDMWPCRTHVLAPLTVLTGK